MDEVVSRISLWQYLPFPWRKYRVVARAAVADLVPDRLPRRGTVVVGEPGRETWIAFDCPCADGHRLIVNLDARRKPAWALTIKPALSLRPSIDDRAGARRCHFVLRNGTVQWVKNSRDQQ